MEYKIEKGLSIEPPFKTGTISRAMYEALKKCAINDSFVIENSHYVSFSFIKSLPEFESKIFVGRKEGDKHKRLWRLK